MNKSARILILIAFILFVIAFLVPNRFSEFGFLLYFNKPLSQWIGPLTTQLFFLSGIGMFLFGWKKTAFFLSIAFLFMNNNLFQKSIQFLFNTQPFWPDGIIGYLIPMVFMIGVGTLLLKKVNRKGKISWYIVFICYVIIFYFIVDDRNCMVYFVSNEGQLTYYFADWIKNCGSFYACDLAGLILNIGIFLEILSLKKANSID